MSLASPEVRFTMDEETKNPKNVGIYEHVATNYVVEEFMLLANISVAWKIVDHYPAYSVLRRHPLPKPKEMEEFKNLLGKYGYDIHAESSKSFAESLDEASRHNDPSFNKTIRILATRCMNQALYFCTADHEESDFWHYGLACPLYTHFTSPIRWYADVLVHRLLAAAINLTSLPNSGSMTDKNRVTK